MKQKKNRKQELKNEELRDHITINDVNIILDNWRMDSVGCLHLRKSEDIKLAINRLDLPDKTSEMVLKHLGNPNHIENLANGAKSFWYFMDCADSGQVSYYNFYCYFENDSLKSFYGAVY